MESGMSAGLWRLKEDNHKRAHLSIANYSKSFDIHMDAYDFAIEWVLMQEEHPINYEYHKLNDMEQQYLVHDKEKTAIIYYLRIWRHYLIGFSLPSWPTMW